eukprot:2777311-Amphidinium_carterae.1
MVDKIKSDIPDVDCIIPLTHQDLKARTTSCCQSHEATYFDRRMCIEREGEREATRLFDIVVYGVLLLKRLQQVRER